MKLFRSHEVCSARFLTHSRAQTLGLVHQQGMQVLKWIDRQVNLSVIVLCIPTLN